MTTATMKRPGLYNAKGIRATALESPPPPVYFCFTVQEAKHLLDRGLTTCAPQDGAAWRDCNLTDLQGRTVYVFPLYSPEGVEEGEKLAAALAARGCTAHIFDVLTAKGGLVEYLRRLKQEGNLSDDPAAIARALKIHLKPFNPPALIAATDKSAASAGEWRDPEPLPDALLPVRPLDSEIIPEALQAWIFDSAERMSSPPDYAFAATLVMLSAIVGRSIGIMPKRLDSWTVYPNLWGAVIGNASAKKTPAVQDALRPLHRLERETRERYEAEIRTHEADKAAAKLRIDTTKADLKEAIRGKQAAKEQTLKAELIAAMTASEAAAPDMRRRYTSDSTIEKLGELLAKPANGRGMLVFRDELSGWFASLEKPGHQTDRTFYLESWNGNVPYTFDRLNRGTIAIPHLCLSIFGGIQPSRILPLIQTTIRENGADGLFQRLQIMVYPDEPSFTWVDRKPDEEAERRVYAIAEALDTRPPEAFGAQPYPGGGHFLRLAPEAYALFKEWYTDLMAALKEGEEHPAFITHIAKYPKLAPALALLYHLMDVADGKAEPGEVSEAATSRAIAASGYFMGHAKRIYGLMVHPGAEAARLLLKKIRTGAVQDGFKGRDIYQKGWAGLDSDTVPAACLMLAEYGYLKASAIESGEVGGRPTTIYLINPKTLGGAA